MIDWNNDMKLFLWGLVIGYWIRPLLSRLWTQINRKLDEWADV